MIKARAVVGACVLCALALGIVAVQSAAAATKGTTGFTCKEKKEPGGAGFSDAHCTSAVGTGAKYEHVAIAEGVKTEGRVTGGMARLHSVISGVNVELQATETVGEASGETKVSAGGEHFIEGTGKTTYFGVSVVKPAEKACAVEGEKVVTKELRGSSKETGMEGKLEPAAGETFAEFNIKGCTGSKALEALNGVYAVSGSIRCSGEGSTVTCTAAAVTGQGTLKLRGQIAGVDVSTTATGRKNSTEPWTPLAVTTVETP